MTSNRSPRFALRWLAFFAASFLASATVTGHELRGTLRPLSTSNGFPEKGRLSTAMPMTIVHGGVSRHYLIQTPSGSGPFPVLIFLHGGTQSASQAWRQTSLPTLADQDGFILVAPDGEDRHWNDGRASTLEGAVSTADDVGFLAAVIDDVVRKKHGDADAVFMIGVSNGGFMTMRFACERGELLRAAGNVISDLPVELQATCRPGKRLPWISINGTSDPLIPFQGQEQHVDRRGRPQPALLSADATFDFWADNAGCAPGQSSELLPDLDMSDHSRAEKRQRERCAGNTTSTQYVLRGAGHVAPGLPVKFARLLVGEANMDIDAGTVIWQHFEATLPVRH